LNKVEPASLYKNAFNSKQDILADVSGRGKLG
jgi:hypothetical protein